MRPDDKVALVTGGARRVGRHIALALAESGYDLTVHFFRAEQAARETVGDIQARGRRALAVRADVTREDEADALLENTVAHFGRLDLLVNNAAVFFRTPLDTLDGETWDRVLDTNLKGVFLCARKAGIIMREHAGGAIVNVADVAGLRPWTDYLPYSVSKAGVIALTQGLAKALAPTVRVNAVVPGPVLFADDTPEEERRRETGRTLLKRAGTPGDVARAVVFLAGE